MRHTYLFALCAIAACASKPKPGAPKGTPTTTPPKTATPAPTPDTPAPDPGLVRSVIALLDNPSPLLASPENKRTDRRRRCAATKTTWFPASSETVYKRWRLRALIVSDAVPGHASVLLVCDRTCDGVSTSEGESPVKGGRFDGWIYERSYWPSVAGGPELFFIGLHSPKLRAHVAPCHLL